MAILERIEDQPTRSNHPAHRARYLGWLARFCAPSHDAFHPIHNKSKARDTAAVSATSVHGQVTSHSTDGAKRGAADAVGAPERLPVPVAVGIQWWRETKEGRWRGGLVPTKWGSLVGFGVFVAVGVGVGVSVWAGCSAAVGVLVLVGVGVRVEVAEAVSALVAAEVAV